MEGRAVRYVRLRSPEGCLAGRGLLRRCLLRVGGRCCCQTERRRNAVEQVQHVRAAASILAKAYSEKRPARPAADPRRPACEPPTSDLHLFVKGLTEQRFHVRTVDFGHSSIQEVVSRWTVSRKHRGLIVVSKERDGGRYIASFNTPDVMPLRSRGHARAPLYLAQVMPTSSRSHTPMIPILIDRRQARVCDPLAIVPPRSTMTAKP